MAAFLAESAKSSKEVSADFDEEFSGPREPPLAVPFPELTAHTSSGERVMILGSTSLSQSSFPGETSGQPYGATALGTRRPRSLFRTHIHYLECL